MSKVKNDSQLDLFCIPEPEVFIPGRSEHAREVSQLVSKILKESQHKDRYAIAAEMSRRCGKDVTKNMLDAYASAGREDHPLPFYMAADLEAICASHALTNWQVDKRGGRVAYGKDALNAEIGRLELLKEETSKKFNKKLRELKKLKGIL